MKKHLSIIGDYDPGKETHVATEAAIRHSLGQLERQMDVDWVFTDDISETMLQRTDGIWVAPGSPYKNMSNVIAAIRFARENGIPCFGTCGGFQHMMIEYAEAFLV